MLVRACAAAGLCAAGAAAPPATGSAPAPVDAWLLAGHGAGGRATFSPPAGASGWLLPLPALPSGESCAQLTFYTPFSGAVAHAGLAARAAVSGAQLALPLLCGAAGALAPYVWLVTPGAPGVTAAFAAVEASSWDSYLIYLPDGSLLAGVNGSALLALEAVGGGGGGGGGGALLSTVWTAAPAALGGGGGAQVLAVSKPVGPQRLPQLQTAGGTGGPDWWGAACTLRSAGGGASTPLTGCAGNADSTVNIGADGLTFYNNQRFESPPGVVRFRAPLTPASAPEPFNTGSQQWPWLIRSLVAGDVFTVEGTVLSRWAGGAGHARLWSATVTANIPSTLLVTDDEQYVIVTNLTHAASFEAATGEPVAQLAYADGGGGAGTTCAAMDSPWMLPQPVPAAAPAPSGTLILLCTPGGGKAWAVFSADMAAGVMSAASAPLSVTADQAVVDERGYVYVVGTDATGGIAMQMVAAPALPLRTATAAAAHAASS